MGRTTFEIIRTQSPRGPASAMKTIVVSRTLQPTHHPDVAILCQDGTAACVHVAGNAFEATSVIISSTQQPHSSVQIEINQNSNQRRNS